MTKMNRILVIEDEPGIRSTIQITLELEGFLVVQASTGAEGISLASDEIQLIILDIGLADQSGFDVLKELRKTQSTPVIMLTARNTEIDKVLGLELGADDYIVKPFSPRELLARIKAILRRVQVKTNENQANLVIKTDKKLIFYFGKLLHLSPYEYKTLELFIKHPGRIFTREEIMDMVWTEPEDSFDRAVDTVIKNIRARMKEIQKEMDPILTRRGQGYGLKENI